MSTVAAAAAVAQALHTKAQQDSRCCCGTCCRILAYNAVGRSGADFINVYLLGKHNSYSSYVKLQHTTRHIQSSAKLMACRVYYSTTFLICMHAKSEGAVLHPLHSWY